MTHGANQAPPPFRLCNLNENCSDKNAHTLENKIFGKQFVVAFHRKHAEDPQGTVRRGSGRKSSLRSCPGEAGRGGSVPHSLALVPLLAGVHLPQSSSPPMACSHCFPVLSLSPCTKPQVTVRKPGPGASPPRVFTAHRGPHRPTGCHPPARSPGSLLRSRISMSAGEVGAPQCRPPSHPRGQALRGTEASRWR